METVKDVMVRQLKAKNLSVAVALSLGLLLVGYVIFALIHQPPALEPTRSPSLVENIATAAHLTWPTSGESAVGLMGSNIIVIHNPQAALPTASTAKMITALMILKAKPLELGQQGPTLTMSASDLAIYASYLNEQGSVVPVQVGEQISEYQALEAMLLPSANNMADSLAIWAYGSLANYAVAANHYLSTSGLSSTHVGSDASGFLPNTTSTPDDLVKIGELVMDNPVLNGIVQQPFATSIPVVGTVKNVNSLVGTDNIVGIKTGNNNQDVGVFVGASTSTVNHTSVTIVSAYMNAPSLALALSQTKPLLLSAQNNFGPTQVLSPNTDVASYYVPWTHRYVEAKASNGLSAYIWGGSQAMLSISGLDAIKAPYPSGASVGSVYTEGDGSVNASYSYVKLVSAVAKPSLWWKLSHP